MAIFISGKNPVRESIRAGQATKILAASRMAKDPLLAEASKAGLPIEFVDEGKLTSMAKAQNHQGILAICKEIRTYSLEEIISSCKNKPYPLLLILDGIEDPHNLGAILRSCDAFGIDGIIMKKRGEVQLNPTVAKVSTGAIHYVKTAVVSNLSAAIDTLKKNGFWIVSSDGSGTQSYSDVDYAPVPDRLEAGLQDYAGIFGTKAAIDYLSRIGMDEVMKHDAELVRYMYNVTKDIKGLHIVGPEDPSQRCSLMSFNIDGLGAHDVAMMLDSMDGIMVRSGMHCAHPFFVARGVEGSVRASVYLYNNRSDIDRLAVALTKISETFGE